MLTADALGVQKRKAKVVREFTEDAGTEEEFGAWESFDRWRCTRQADEKLGRAVHTPCSAGNGQTGLIGKEIFFLIGHQTSSSTTTKQWQWTLPEHIILVKHWAKHTIVLISVHSHKTLWGNQGSASLCGSSGEWENGRHLMGTWVGATGQLCAVHNCWSVRGGRKNHIYEWGPSSVLNASHIW